MNQTVSKVEWLKGVVLYGSPKTRAKDFKLFLAFELYNIGCRLSGYKTVDFLDPEPLAAGSYILVRPLVPPGVRLLNKVFSFGKEAHTEYVPYTPEAAEEMRQAGKHVEVIKISYELKFEPSNV